MAIESRPSPIAISEAFRKKRRLPLWLEPYYVLVTKKYMGTFGGLVLLIMILMAVFADVLAPFNPLEQNMSELLKPPTARHLLGTDQLGRDVFSRLLDGARTSLYVGAGVVVISTILSTVLGGISGYIGGKFDLVYQRLVDAFLAIPQLVLLLTIISVIGPGLVNIILTLSLRQAIGQSRVQRSAVMGILENQYVDGAKAVGASHVRILSRYILPNIMAPIIVVASVALGQAILAEATLSFLGWGVPPPHPTWGAMLSDEARRFMIDAPWMAIAPGMALSLAVFGINMFGDGLRDVLDPRMRGSR